MHVHGGTRLPVLSATRVPPAEGFGRGGRHAGTGGQSPGQGWGYPDPASAGALGRAGLVDLEDQFRRIAAMADGEREYLQGLIEFYRTRIGTKMAVAAERLAVIAAVTLPVTALSSVMGMNVIVNDHTQAAPLALLLAGMVVMSVILLVWTRRKGWW
jgi:Mg2+ and Co2+ transporter CorA